MQTSQNRGEKPSPTPVKCQVADDDFIKRLCSMEPLTKKHTHETAPSATGVKIMGDEMEPFCRPATKIYCEKVAKEKWGGLTTGVFLIAVKNTGRLLFARIRYITSFEVRLYFDNPTYADIVLPMSKVMCIYRGHTIFSAPVY